MHNFCVLELTIISFITTKWLHNDDDDGLTLGAKGKFNIDTFPFNFFTFTFYGMLLVGFPINGVEHH